MEKFQSLADLLGVPDPTEPVGDAPVVQITQPTEKINLDHLSPREQMRAFAKGILDSRQYRESLMRRIVVDELPAAVEAMLYHYAAGKPTEYIEVKDTSEDFDGLTADELRARALAIASRIKDKDKSVH